MMIKLNRRQCLAAAVSTPFVGALADNQLEIIDTHTHFYDPTRPQGVPWPGKNSTLYRKVAPAEFVNLTKAHGVTGTIVVEASSWIEDNQYLLDLAVENEIIVGVVGSLLPGSQDFKKHLKRFTQNSYFRGVRVSPKALKNLDKQEVRDDFKLLADAGLVVDINGLRTIEQTLKLAKLYPSLKIVIEHLSSSGESLELLKKTGALPNVSAKVSHVLRREEEQPILDLTIYKKGLDELWDIFGPDKLMYGSNWPVSDKYNGTYEEVFTLIDSYTHTLASRARAKFFGLNAKNIYSC